jgi:hypothetical protein
MGLFYINYYELKRNNAFLGVVNMCKQKNCFITIWYERLSQEKDYELKYILTNMTKTSELPTGLAKNRDYFLKP